MSTASGKQIRIGALLSYISIGINIIIGLTYTPWMIHSIGKNEFGIYTLAMSIISLFVFDFGLGNAVTRYIAKYNAEDNPQKVSHFLGIVYKLYIMIDILILLIVCCVYFAIPYLYKGITPDEMHQFKIVFAFACSFAIISFPFIPLTGILSANEQFIWMKISDVAHKIIVVVLMGICLCLGYGLYALVIVNIIASIITIIMKLILVKIKTTATIDWSFWNKDFVKEILSFSIWITVIVIAQRCIFNIAPSVLGIVSTTGAIAIMGVTITVEGYTSVLGGALNGLFLPRVSKMIADGRNDRLTLLMIKVGRIQILIVSFIFITFVALGKQFVNLWVGESFADVYSCSILILLPAVVHIPQEIASSVILAKNKVRSQAYVYIIVGILNLLLAFPLSHQMGAVGFCIAVLVSFIVRTILLNILYHKELNIDIPLFFKKTFIIMAVPLLFVMFTNIAVDYFLKLEGWFGLVIKGMLNFAVFFFVSWSFIMNDYEKGLLYGIIKKLRA